jgi:iron complex transport system ATP-binding protein
MLSLEAVSLNYHSRRILREVTFDVQPGEVLALIGPNGVGKSTLIHAASGGHAPISGRISVDGRDLYSLPIELRARQIAVVPQAVHLPEAFTVMDTVLMGRTAYLGWLGRESAADRAIAIAALERTCAIDLAARYIGELSGGEQQGVLIARALAQAAPVLLMDEPTAHLDLKHQADILKLICGLAHDENLAVLIVLHDLNLAAQYADRVALLSDGRLQVIGPPRQVLTADYLSPAYGLPISIFPHPLNGAPLVLPTGR